MDAPQYPGLTRTDPGTPCGAGRLGAGQPVALRGGVGPVPGRRRAGPALKAQHLPGQDLPAWRVEAGNGLDWARCLPVNRR